MRIKIDTLPEEGLTLSLKIPADDCPQLAQWAQTDGFQLNGPVIARVKVVRRGRFIDVSGQFQTLAGFCCSRCLQPFQTRLSGPIQVTFGPPTAAGAPSAEPIDLLPSEIEIMPLPGPEIDLVDVLQEQLLLTLPMQPLCHPACKGLCPGCGADLNQGICTCASPLDQNPFAILKNLGKADPQRPRKKSK